MHKKGHLSYTGKDDKMRIVGGEAIFDLPQGIDPTSIKEAFKEALEEADRDNPDSPLVNRAKQVGFAAEATTAWLMEYMIPRAKMAIWMREYQLKVDKNKERIAAGLVTKEELARDTMKFIEDRFGEVNWKNMWMKPTIKSALQFTFRSFTWFTGSWKALGKAGLDITKLGWFRLKDVGLAKDQRRNYELTEKGWWGVNAFISHAMTVMILNTLYAAGLAASGGEEAEDDEAEDTVNMLITKALFPRVDMSDPQARLTVPSYVTEAYKIARHIGLIGSEKEYSKLVSGRVNSLVSKSIEAFYHNEDWRGVTISDENDTLAGRTFDKIKHVIGIAPISISSAYKDYQQKGLSPSLLLALGGFTDAPAAAKRSDAANKAFALRRKQFGGMAITEEEMEEKDDVRNAMYKYGQGDPTDINQMIAEGKVTPKQFEKAKTRLALIGGKKNPTYKNPLSQALKGLTMDGAIEVWDYMTDKEKEKHRSEIVVKYHNMMARKDQPPQTKQRISSELRELGILR